MTGTEQHLSDLLLGRAVEGGVGGLKDTPQACFLLRGQTGSRGIDRRRCRSARSRWIASMRSSPSEPSGTVATSRPCCFRGTTRCRYVPSGSLWRRCLPMGDALPFGATISPPGTSVSSAITSGATARITALVSISGRQNISATVALRPGCIGKAQTPSTADLIPQVSALRWSSFKFCIVMLIFGITAQAFPAEFRRGQIIEIVIGRLVTPIRAVGLHGIASPLG